MTKHLLEPLGAIIKHTKKNIDNWKNDGEYRHVENIFKNNIKAKRLIVVHSSLLSEEIRRDAIMLIEHYDDFSRRFELESKEQSFKPNSRFKFTIPTNRPFPQAAAQRLFSYNERCLEKA